MIGRHKFKVGQRVRVSAYGVEHNILPPHRRDTSGVVVKVDEFNSPSVRWDYRRTASGYHPYFIEPDHRRRKSQG